MVTREITDLDQLTIVKLLASGRDADFVGTVVKVSRDIVIDIASRHGHPDQAKLQWAADIMQANIDKKRTSELPAATGHRPTHRANGSTLAAVPTPRPAEPKPTRQPIEPGTAAGSSSVGTPVIVGTHLELVDLLDRAGKSAKAATRSKGERLAKLIAELRQAIRDETEDRARAEREKKQKDAAIAEIVALEAQLAAAREKLGIRSKEPAGKKPKRAISPAALTVMRARGDHQVEVLTRHGVTRSEVISWARAHGWPDVSPRGRFIKTEILDAYDRQQGR